MSIEDVLVEKVVDVLSKYIDPLVDQIKGQVARSREVRLVESRRAFAEYYRTTIAKYANTKTLLYRTTAVPLYDFYVDLDLEAPLAQVTSTKSIEFVLVTGPRLLLTGGAGSGKSTLLKHLFLQSIARRAGVPLFVELRQFSDFEGNFEDLLYDVVSSNNLSLDRNTFDEMVAAGRFILCLDGFDEVASERADLLARQLTAFGEQHDRVILVVTSRPDYYRFVGWSGFREMKVMPLTRSRCLELVRRLAYDPGVKDAFARAVEGHLFDSHRSFLENPLLTTLMLMTFEQFGNIERRMHLFYGQAYETLYGKHDATKVGYRREMLSDLDADDFRAAVAAFAAQSYFAESVSFTETKAREYAGKIPRLVPLRREFKPDAFLKDLTTAVSVLVHDGLELTYTHRSFQEYFTAVFILQHAGAHRRDLMGRLYSRLSRDTTAQLLFEMDQAVFEDDFLRDAVTRLHAAIGYVESLVAESWFIGFARKHLEITVGLGGPESIEVKAAAKLSGEFILVEFILRNYFAATLDWVASDREDVRTLHVALSAERKRKNTDESQAIEARTIIILRSDDYDDDAVAAAFSAAFAPGREALLQAARVFERIDRERSERDNAIERLLLS